MKNVIKISELIPDDKNFNKGTDFGKSLIKKSLENHGAGRSILLDKNNRIIAGNKSVEGAEELGMEDVQIVESDGKRIIAVKRMDIDLDTPEGRELALADNATAKANIVMDAEVIEAVLGIAACEEWGITKADTIDYEQRNQEVDTDSFANEMIIRLKFTEEEYNTVLDHLAKIAETPEAAVWKLLKL